MKRTYSNSLNKKEFDYVGITEWHEAGYLGQGVTIASLENNSGHGAMVADVLQQIAPKATVLTRGVPGARWNNGKLVQEYYDVHEQYYKNISTEGTSVVTMSLGGNDYDDTAYFLREYFLKNHIVCFKSAGNNGEKGTNAGSNLDEWIPVAACQFYGEDTPSRVPYSSVGDRVMVSGFTSIDMTWTSNFNGTSAASPFVAGMMALYHCWFLENIGRLPSYNESVEFLIDNAEDLGVKGRDPEYGYGLFRLPNLSNMGVNIEVTTNREYAIVHHTAAWEKDAEQVRRYHVNSLGYRDIGYNYIIEYDGTIEEGRSLSIAGAHTRTDRMNTRGIGVVLLGNLDEKPPTKEQIQSLDTLLQRLMKEHGFPAEHILGHGEVKDAKTACPGKYMNMDEVRRRTKDLANSNPSGNSIVMDVPSRIENGRTLVPLRHIAEALRATVGYENGLVTITNGDIKITHKVGTKELYIS